jgi:hypothetical protein
LRGRFPFPADIDHWPGNAALERYYRIKEIQEANEYLVQKLRATDKENRRLRRELKVKESLLRAMDYQNGTQADQDGEKLRAYHPKPKQEKPHTAEYRLRHNGQAVRHRIRK